MSNKLLISSIILLSIITVVLIAILFSAFQNPSETERVIKEVSTATNYIYIKKDNSKEDETTNLESLSDDGEMFVEEEEIIEEFKPDYNTFIIVKNPENPDSTKEAVMIYTADSNLVSENLIVIKLFPNAVENADYDELKKFLDSNGIELIIGYCEMDTGIWTDVRRATGVSIIVRFAKGERSPTGGDTAIESFCD